MKLQLDPDTPEPVRRLVHDPAPAIDPASADQAREDAFDALHSWPVWHEKRQQFVPTQLHPYSSGREALFYRLRAADGALPLGKTLEQLTTFLSDAIKILWLCCHEPSQWRSLRGDPAAFLEAIETWGDRNVPRSRQVEAVNLALQIFNEAGLNQAVAEPSERTADPGN